MNLAYPEPGLDIFLYPGLEPICLVGTHDGPKNDKIHQKTCFYEHLVDLGVSQLRFTNDLGQMRVRRITPRQIKILK